MNIHDLRKTYPNSWLLEYIEKCKSKEIIIGKELMMMLDILLSHFDNPDIRFDTSESDIRIKFIEKECKHYEAPFAGKPFILTLRQKAFIEAFYSFKIFDEEVGRWVRLYQEYLLLVGRKCGKALALDTPIPTPNGWTTMGELNIGDYVFNEKGEPVKIITISDVFYNHKCYEVEFEDGEKIIADEEHIWTVMTKNSRRTLKYSPTSNRKLTRQDYRDGNGYFNITTKDMASDFVRVRKDGKGKEYKYRVPMNRPIQYSEKKLPVKPYTLGVWLGDGDSDNTRVTCSEEDINEMIGYIEEDGYSTKVIARKNRISAIGIDVGTAYKRNGRLRKQLQELGVFRNKHIPTIYLQSSIEQRRELLKGLMDTDGYIAKNGQCEFTQSEFNIIMQFSELLSSLGIKHSIREKNIECYGKKCTAYSVLFHVDKRNSCFKLKRKHERLKDKLSDRMLNKSIVNITEIESVPTKCIGVDSPNHLYIAGNRMTVTHNSPLVAAMDLAEWFCGEMGTKILCASNDYAQADIMFQAINAMREESPTLERVTRKNIKGIFFGNPKQKKKRGKFSSQNKGCITKISAKTGAKEGKNIKVGSVDEVHEMKDNSLIMPIRQALSTQDEPIYGELTTEGFVRDGYLDQRLIEARKVLKGELDRPRWLIWLHTQDSEEEIWQDESSWVKSNPDLGVIKKWSFLRQMVAEAKESSATRAFVLAKDFNLPQSASSAWLPESKLVNLGTFSLEDFRGAFYISGNDFAETTDLCASTILLKRPNDKKTYFHTHYWIPESKLENSPDDVDYRQWEREGWITIVPGNSVETSVVADWHFELLKEYDLKPFKAGYDNRFAKDFINRFEEIFGEKMTINIPQKFDVLNNPMRTLEADIRDGLINYQDNPVCLWCFRNTGLVLDKLGRVMPTKMDKTKRIDGTASKIDAYTVLEWHRSEFMNLIG